MYNFHTFGKISKCPLNLQRTYAFDSCTVCVKSRRSCFFYFCSFLIQDPGFVPSVLLAKQSDAARFKQSTGILGYSGLLGPSEGEGWGHKIAYWRKNV